MGKEKEETKAVAKAETKEVSSVGVDAGFLEFAESAGSNGFERMDNLCVAVNFLKIAQSNTPGVNADESDPAYKPGLKVGKFYSSVSGNVFGSTVRVVILGFFRNYCQFTKKDRKFVGAFSIEEFEREVKPQLRQDGMNFYSTDGLTEFVDTRNFALVLPDFPDEGLIFFPLVKTGIRHSQRWLTQAQAVRIPGTDKGAPIFACVWELTTALNKNDKGQWYTIGEKSTNVKNLGFIPVEMRPQILTGFKMAKEFIERTRIDYGTADTVEGHTESDEKADY
jgi:hypothetical protein